MCDYLLYVIGSSCCRDSEKTASDIKIIFKKQLNISKAAETVTVLGSVLIFLCKTQNEKTFI